MDLNELQSLINNIALWYEIKYPNYTLELENSRRNHNFKEVEEIYKYLTFSQFLIRLSLKQSMLMQGRYQSRMGNGILPIYQNGRKIREENVVILELTEYENYEKVYVLANADTGGIYHSASLTKYLGEMHTNIDGLTYLLETEYKKDVDASDLKKCLFNHKCDIKLRNKIIELAALKLLYSKNTTPKLGFIRANRLIEEMNDELDLQISNKKIGEIMKKDYEKKSKNNLDIARKIQLERYLFNRVEIDNLTSVDFQYLQYAKSFPMYDVLELINFYRLNALWISTISIEKYFAREYKCHEITARSRLEEVMEMSKYENCVEKELVKTRKKMIKKLKKSYNN